MRHLSKYLFVLVFCRFCSIQDSSSEIYIYQDSYQNTKVLKFENKEYCIKNKKYVYYPYLLDGIYCRIDSVGQFIGLRIKPDTILIYKKNKGIVETTTQIFPEGEFDLFKYVNLTNDEEWEICYKGMHYNAILKDSRDAVYTPFRFFKNSFHIYLDGINIEDADFDIWIDRKIGIVRIDSGIFDYRLYKITKKNKWKRTGDERI